MRLYKSAKELGRAGVVEVVRLLKGGDLDAGILLVLQLLVVLTHAVPSLSESFIPYIDKSVWGRQKFRPKLAIF
jgi:hypothetical protein